MLLKDLEEAYRITTDEQRQELSGYGYKENYPVGSNKLNDSIYYPTLNKTNARVTEEKIDDYATGDIGVSKTTKKLTDINQEYYYVQNKLNELHTKTYDAGTGKDVQKEIIHKYWNYLGSRGFGVYGVYVYFQPGYVYSNSFRSGDHEFGYGSSSYFKSFENILLPRPVVFLSSANNYYKEQGEGEYATYSLIKEESAESQYPKIQNPYNVSLNNVSLKGTYADRLLYESKLDAPAQDVPPTNLTRADGTKVIDNITYTVEGLPENIAYDVVKKEVDGKEEVTVQIYPKELKVYANISKKHIYDGAKYSYNILLNKNEANLSITQFDETKDGKVVIATYTNKKDIIDENGNAVNYTLNFANFNDAVRKDNTYYTNTLVKDDKANSNEIIYKLNIVYDKTKYDELVNKITTDLSDIEKRTNILEENDNAKKTDTIKFEEEIKTAETNGGTDVLGKKKLEEGIADIKKRQEAEKAEREKLEQELKDLIAGNEKALETDTNLKSKADELTKRINDLKETIEKDDTKIKELEERIAKIKVLDVKDIEDLKKKVADLEKVNEQNKKDLEENNKTIKNLNELIEKLKEENEEVINKITKEKEELEDKNKKLEEENKKLKDKIVELNAEIEQLKNFKQDNKNLEKKIAGLEAKILEAEAKQNDLQEKLDKCSKHGKDLEEKIKVLEKTIKEQDEKIKKLEQEKADLEKRNKELEEKNKLNEEELKEKELLEKKIKELEEKAKILEAEKEELAKAAMDKKEQEQKDRKKEAEAKEPEKVADANENNNRTSVRNNAVASNSKKNNSKNNTSENKIPHAGAGSVIMLTIITIGAIVYTKKVMSRK